MAEVEFAGMTFKGGKMMVLLTALSTLGGGAWAGFEFYKDYMDMREVVQNIDTDAIAARNDVIETKLDEAIDYTTNIKGDLRDQIMTLDNQVREAEKRVREVEAQIRESEKTVREIVRAAEENFDAKRDSLQSDYDAKADRLRDTSDQKIKDVEERLNQKLQRALDNPLAN
jgi:chromosome segregation ATPase